MVRRMFTSSLPLVVRVQSASSGQLEEGFWTYLYFRIRHSFAHVWTIVNKMASFDIIAHVWTILNKMASFGVNIYRPSASEHGQNITNITMIKKKTTMPLYRYVHRENILAMSRMPRKGDLGTGLGRVRFVF